MIGVGWVGLVTAACFAELGQRVVAMDIDAAKIKALARGNVPIHEPGLAELVERNGERLQFTTEMDDVLESARLLFCCVDTPPTYSGDADLSQVDAVVSQLDEDGDHALVMKSTVPSGTGRAIRRSAPKLAYVSCPEFLREGSAVQDFLHPDRVVIGADPEDEWAADAVEEIYRPVGGEIVRTDVASGEMIKLAANAFLATKISFINEIANVCEEVGADVTEVSLVLASRLQGEGAEVRAYDPVAEGRARELLPNVEMYASPEEALEGADAAVLVTEWQQFAELDWASVRERMANALVVDGRNFLDAEGLRKAGFAYEGIGRPSESSVELRQT